MMWQAFSEPRVVLTTTVSDLKLPATQGLEEKLWDLNQLLSDPKSVFPVAQSLFLGKLVDIRL